MTYKRTLTTALLSLPLMALASCNGASAGDSAEVAQSIAAGEAMDIQRAEYGSFDDPWAIAIHPQTAAVFITERGGTMKFVDPASGRMGTVTGLPQVDAGGQGGLGDFVFSPDFSDSGLVYLSWVEAGNGDTRGAVVGRGKLVCEQADACEIRGLSVIWRQAPKVSGRGHFSHRIAFSPDGQHLFVSSGDRQKMEPAQDTSNTLGTVVRLNLDGSPAAGNPMADKPSPANEIWSYGHRNVLGLAFDASGELWDLEHGPAGGDELNRVQSAANYGWPTRSNGNHYNGRNIPDHTADDGFTKPAISWTPVIAPGDFIFYGGDMFGAWQGDAIIAGLSSEALVQVHLEGDTGTEVARYPMDRRIRDVAEGPDGAVWVIEDGGGGRLLKLTI